MDNDAVYLLAASPFPSVGREFSLVVFHSLTEALPLAGVFWTPAPPMSLATLFLAAN